MLKAMLAEPFRLAGYAIWEDKKNYEYVLSQSQEQRKLFEEVTFIWSAFVLRIKLRRETQTSKQQSTKANRIPLCAICMHLSPNAICSRNFYLDKESLQ